MSLSQRIWDRSLVVTALVVGVISAVSVWLAWQTSSDLSQRVSFASLAPILSAAAVSYSLRVLRFHYFLTRSGVPISLRNTAVVQAVGFALSVTPGHIGEVFKLHLIRERAGTPVAQTAPLLLLDRLTEGGGFLILTTLSLPGLPAFESRMSVPAWLVVGLGAIVLFAVAQRFWNRAASVEDLPLSRIAAVRKFLPHLINFWNGVKTGFTPAQILGGLAISSVARFSDGLVVLFAARMFGTELTLPAAVFILAVSGLTGGLSFLPAGTGAVETTMTGLLVVNGATLTNALSITLLARLATLWLWVAMGLGLAFGLRLSARRRRSEA